MGTFIKWIARNKLKEFLENDHSSIKWINVHTPKKCENWAFGSNVENGATGPSEFVHKTQRCMQMGVQVNVYNVMDHISLRWIVFLKHFSLRFIYGKWTNQS
jgi:hypothetical protein